MITSEQREGVPPQEKPTEAPLPPPSLTSWTRDSHRALCAEIATRGHRPRYGTYKDMACAEETKATLIDRPGRKPRKRLDDAGDDAKKTRRRDPFDAEPRPDDHGACPRPHVYRPTQARGAPYCDFLMKQHGGPECVHKEHIQALKGALEHNPDTFRAQHSDAARMLKTEL